MQPLFPPWANTVVRVALFAIAATIVLVPALAIAWVRTPWVTGVGLASEQPLQFDHRHHVFDDGIDCRYCHTSVERSASAGYPATSVCIGCHAQVWNDSPQLQPVRDSYRTGKPIHWRRVHDLPDFVFFQHGPHIHAGVGCETCHGRIDQMAAVRPAEPLTMQWCLDCHRDPTPHLRDPARVTEMGLDAHPDERARGARPAGEVSPPIHCVGCHR